MITRNYRNNITSTDDLYRFASISADNPPYQRKYQNMPVISATPSYSHITERDGIMKTMRVRDTTIETLPRNPASYFEQPKLKGIRGKWHPDKQTLCTRNGRIITSAPHIVEALAKWELHDLPLDGEIFNNELLFNEINGLARRKNPVAKSSLLQFHVFDIALDMIDQGERFRVLHSFDGCGPIKIVKTGEVRTATEIKSRYRNYLNQGYEGIILRDRKAFYCEGKSHEACFRIKPVHDLEAKLIGFKPGNTALHVETFGSLILQLPNGKTFTCNGLKEKDRKRLWQEKPIGRDITIKYNDMSPDGKPESPRFEGIRWDV